MKFILTSCCLFFVLCEVFGQDTLLLDTKPGVILKSWHPEFKEFPNLKIGEQKILFTVIPEFEKISIRDNDINLKVTNGQVKIEETGKTNQYLVKVNETSDAYIAFEVWFDLGDKTILLKQNSSWKNIKDCYPVQDNRIMIESIKLKIVK